MSNSPQRVLLYRLGSLGDTLVALPAIHLVARGISRRRTASAHKLPGQRQGTPRSRCPRAHRAGPGLFPVRRRHAQARELLRLWWQLIRWRPQVLVVSRSLARPRLRQTGRALLPSLRHLPHHRPPPHRGHAAQPPPRARISPRARGRAASPATSPSSATPTSTTPPAGISTSPAEHARAREALLPAGDLPILAVSVGTKVQAKDWGRDNWRALLTRLATLYPGHALALAGAPEEATPATSPPPAGPPRKSPSSTSAVSLPPARAPPSSPGPHLPRTR